MKTTFSCRRLAAILFQHINSCNPAMVKHPSMSTKASPNADLKEELDVIRRQIRLLQKNVQQTSSAEKRCKEKITAVENGLESLKADANPLFRLTKDMTDLHESVGME